MKKIYKMMFAVALLLAAVFQAKAQTLPATDGSYFYIQFSRGTNLMLQNEGSANQIKSADLVFGKATQLWKAVSNGTGGYFIVSKAKDTDGTSELAIVWNAGAGRFIVSAYPTNSTALYTTTTGITTNANYLPACVITLAPGASQGMNPVGGSSVGKTMGLWNIDDEGDALKFIPETSTKSLLQAYLVQVNAASASASLNPGNHSAEVLATFRAAIVIAQAVYDDTNSTLDAIVTAGNTLRDAFIAYNTAPFTILPAISSNDASNEKWYFFQGTRPSNTYMTSMGAGAGVVSKPVIPDDTQLWKIVDNTNPAGTLNGYALVNKVSGEYLNADFPNDNALNSTPNMPVRNLVFNISDIMTNGVARFWIENAGVTSESTNNLSFRLHAGLTSIINWTGNRYDNSSWLLMDYSISLKEFLKDAINVANVIVNDATIPVGTQLGQYHVGAQADLATVVSTVRNVYDNAAASDADVKTAIANLNAAVIICKGRRSDAVISTAENPRWYVIRNLLRTDVNLVKNQVITTNGVLENEVLLCKALANTNEQLWRFESNATGGVKIINAAKSTLGINDSGYDVSQKLVSVANASGYIIDILGTGYKLTSIAGNQLHEKDNGNLVTYNDIAGSASNWAVEERSSGLFLAQTITFGTIPTKLTTDAAFNLTATTNASGPITYTSSNTAVATVAGNTVTIVGVAGTSDITASNAGDATYAQASVKQTLTVNVFTGVQDVTDGISVVAKNGIIVVTGTDAPVTAFTVTGSEVDAKRVLTPGIYIVKVNGRTVKLNVR